MMPTWSYGEEPVPPRPRTLYRNCGQLLGNLAGLLPFLYIAQYGASLKDLRALTTTAAPGLFAIAACTYGEHPGLAPRVGLVLPVSLCRDAKARRALLDVHTLIAGQEHAKVSERRHEVQARLDVAFGGDLVIAERETLDGFFALRPATGLFQRLQASFDYVTEVVDDPAGAVRITNATLFAWRTYGELMEWYHTQHGTERDGAWSPLTPSFVGGNTGALYEYPTQRWARTGLRTPAEEPSLWFVLRPGLPDADLRIRLEMREYGWARLHLTLDGITATIRMSEVFDPFDELVAWGREIDEGDLPIQMEVDEEGQEAVLTVLRTDDPARVLLRVARDYSGEVLLEGIVARTILAAELKSELRRFFTTEFDPQHWDRGRDDDPGDGYIQTRDRVLNHAWLASAT